MIECSFKIDLTHCIETSQHLKAHRVDDLKIRDNDSVTIAPSYFFLLIVILNLEINRNMYWKIIFKEKAWLYWIDCWFRYSKFDMSCFLNDYIVWEFSYWGPILQYKIHICLLWPSQGEFLNNLTYSIFNGNFSYWGPK